MQKRDILNSPRLTELKKHRQRAVLNKILFYLFGFIVIFILFIFLSQIKAVNISTVEITGNKVIDTTIIKDAVQSQLAGKYIWLFPKTNLLFYPENAIKKELQNKFKRLKDINLSIKDNKILSVSLTERKASYTWCGDAPFTVGEKCYFTDEDGYVFDEAPYFSGEVYFKFYGKIDNVFGAYFSKQNFKQLILFKNILLDLGLKPVSLYDVGNGDVQIFLLSKNSTTPGPKIMFKIDSDFQNIGENLKAALTTEPLKTEFKNKYSSLLYIDLRFGNKVYYKFSTPNKPASLGGEQ